MRRRDGCLCCLTQCRAQFCCVANLFAPHLAKGQEYTDQGQAYYEERYRERVIANLNRRAQQLGLQVVPWATPAPA